MNVTRFAFCLAMAGLLLSCGTARAVDLLAPGDSIVPIDLDPSTSTATLPPAAEGVANLFDTNSGTKYLNFGEENSGFIVTPLLGLSLVQSVQFTSANDADVRDPMTWILYGTNSPIVSGNNTAGDSEPWTLIASGSTGLTTARLTAAPPVNITNFEPYTSYKMLFPTVRNAASANSMQVSEVQLFELPDGVSPIVAAGSPALAIDVLAFASSSPGGEPAPSAIDGNSATKYLNFGEDDSGFIVTPSVGAPTIVSGFTITTANDAAERDPASWELYGTNDPVTSPAHSRGINENWTLIDSGTVDLPTDRFAVGPTVPVAGSTPYLSYRLTFPTVRDGAAANSMQIADVQFHGSIVPEPSTWVLATLGVAGLGLARRRRR